MPDEIDSLSVKTLNIRHRDTDEIIGRIDSIGIRYFETRVENTNPQELILQISALPNFPSLMLFSEGGTASIDANLGNPGIRLWKATEDQIRLGYFRDDGGPYIELSGTDSDGTAVFAIHDDGGPFIKLSGTDSDGTALFGVSSDVGYPYIIFEDSDEIRRLLVQLFEDGAQIQILDSAGNVEALLP